MKLAKVISDYVQLKQGMGMRFKSDSVILKAFIKASGDLDIADIQKNTVALFLAGKGPLTSFWHRKFQALNGLYRFAIGREYVSSSPLPKITPKQPSSFTPYIYSSEELKRLLEATSILENSKGDVDANTFRVLLLLLYGTGLRISEAIKLEVKDVDIPSKILTILDSKFYKNRFVPIGSRLTETLQVYLEKNHIKVIRVNENSTPFLLNRHKKRVTRTCAELTFRRLCLHAKVSRNDNSRYQPRLHDIRHTFCVHRLVDWYRQGADVQRLLPYLSTYLGHINIEGTQRYLTMTPDLLQAANARFEQYAFRGQI